jgi:site-specific recombinase XerD
MSRINRPPEWDNMSNKERNAWLSKQRKAFNVGRKSSLKKSDRQRVWNLIKKYDNKSMVADLLGVNRSTIHRFLDRYPIPQNFIISDNAQIEDYPEIQTWLRRMGGFAKQSTIKNYLMIVRNFFEWMKQFHSERAKPSLWTSDDITEYIYGNKKTGWDGFKSYQWHSVIVPLRSLAKKAQTEFPQIDIGLLPTKKTHKAKRSLAGHEEYYLEPNHVRAMIQEATQKRDKALISFIYNTAIRTTASRKLRIEDLDIDTHFCRINDKGGITWLVYGLSEETLQFLREYLEERGYPKSGWLFANPDETQITNNQINKIIRTLGRKAGIEGKKLTAKVFRKSLVKNALTPEAKGGMGMNPISLIGTGKGTKTCFCVGWSDMKVLMEHYAPQLMGQIEQDRQKFRILTDKHTNDLVSKQPTESREKITF